MTPTLAELNDLLPAIYAENGIDPADVRHTTVYLDLQDPNAPGWRVNVILPGRVVNLGVPLRRSDP